MGYFATPNESSAAPGRVAPLTPERITSALDSRGWNYDIDDDGDVNGNWDGHLFYFLRLGQSEEIFMVRGRWEARIPLDMGEKILPVLNTWHKEKLFPKAVLVDFVDDGNARVFTEVSIDCEHGISDEQLTLHIDAGINSALQLFEQLNENFPGLQTTASDDMPTEEQPSV